MKAPYKVKVNARNRPLSNGEYQTDVEPNRVLDLEDIAKDWAEQSAIKPALAKSMLYNLEDYVLDALGRGCQLNFGLVSFYPRLSGNLPSRDSNPATEGLYMRGAVKARRGLVSGLRHSLVAENAISSVRTAIWSVGGEDGRRRRQIVAGEVLPIYGESIPVVAGREDEGVWLESKRKGKVAQARVVESSEQCLKVVFDELPPSGMYFLVVATRCGRDPSFKSVRCRAEVRV